MLWEIIKEIEEKNGIEGSFIHHNYDTGRRELNVSFNNDIADKILWDSNIKETKYCACWE